MSSAQSVTFCWTGSGYLTDADLDLQVAGARALGWQAEATRAATPDLRETTILVTSSKLKVTEALIAQAPQLELIVTGTSGHDHIDRHAAAQRGIRVARSPLARRDAVVATSLALALSLLRDIPSLHQAAQEGVWARDSLKTRPLGHLHALEVVLIGGGIIGQAAAKAWAGCGSRVHMVDPRFPDSACLEDVLPTASIVSLHCALTPKTHRMIDQSFLDRLPDGAHLINTARGGLICQEALFADQRLGGIGLDVFPKEPPEALARLAERPRTLLLPHAAGYHEGLGRSVADEILATLNAWKAGRTLPHEVLADDHFA